jgi:predicted DNA-binding transcriptional regulator AlpA
MSVQQESEKTRERYLSPEQVCAIAPGMTKSNLAQLRFTGKGPRYRKPTPRTVIYAESEVIAWIEASARQGTSEVSA